MSSTSADVIRAAIDIRRFPWVRPLVGAYANDFPSVQELFPGNPTDPDAWRETIQRVGHSAHNRAAVSAIVSRQLERRGAPQEARRAAEKLEKPGAVAIVTGQQAGLFGGPLYTLLKAITAIQLARQVEHLHGTPATAIFWVECEDHDWDEVKSARVLDADMSSRDISLGDLAGARTLPVASLLLDDGIVGAIQALDNALEPSGFRSELLSALRDVYKPGAGMATAFAGWLDRLLGHQGLIVFEAQDVTAKPLVADILSRELRNPSRTADLVRSAGDSMRRLGHATQVDPPIDGTALFYLDGTGRRAIKRREGALAIGSHVRSTEALVSEAETHPEYFSPNVLLRPLVQDRLFPTACYVGGPSELAYQAQLGPLYREFGVEAPMLYSRASVTLLDSGAAKFMERHDVAFEALQTQDDSVLNQLLASLMPPSVGRAFEDATREVTARLAEVQATVSAVDPNLAGVAETTRVRMLESLKVLQGKVVQTSKRKDDTLRRQFLHARSLTFPGGVPQERALSMVFFLNRYGFGIVDRLIDVLPLDMGKHYVLTI